MKEITLQLALSFLNKPYIWGGKNPVFGMDCSGLVCELLQSVGILKGAEEYNARTLYVKMQKISKEMDFPEFGSLIFFGKEVETISHVGFGLNAFQMIEAGGGNSATINSDIAEKTNAYVKIRPYRHRSDLFAILNPNYNWG